MGKTSQCKNWTIDRLWFVLEFDDVEWDAYAGAEQFGDGSRPVIASSDGGACPACVVIGAGDGIEVYCGSEGERGYSLRVEGLKQAMAGLLVATVMRDIMRDVPATLTLDEEREVFSRYGFIKTFG